VIIVLVIALSSAKSSDQGGIIVSLICGGLIFWGILYAIVNAIINNQLPKPLRDQNTMISKSVAISSFSSLEVTFKFTNESFGDLFGGLNGRGSSDLLASILANALKKK
jgi:hypothetical protein